ncbi:predicted protein [Postia placenta Mad-698-R]|uniref:Uncharacterized protein n=1 Tax=Postia placenta MAD-698-R-SB12 TaxID=670580 RepID=A0A1X6NDX6_9APHY|nr:hypothetical protein POSPLADRAFT_1127187 [Postia placenta MAD-698-R-SB12]EED79642.1 predicted protein [Postia placenta Mad-698-R]OSX66847.1 hypothetical protein POSPLADRAFT_1127187 [Postia placenta MAD-698-R-SB12]
MDQSASIIAALNAGKLPSSQQAGAAFDLILDSNILNAEPSADGGELSAQGKVLQKDLRDVLSAYKQLGQSKNGDDLVQESLWRLSEVDVSSTSTQAPIDIDSEQARQDSQAVARAVRTVASLVWENLSQEGRSVFHDFASFMRLALADAADYVAHGAEATAESLRQLDTEVQEGQRNDLGVRKRKAEDEDVDTKVKFERTMDKTKDVGSKTIGAGQAALATAQETADRTSSRLQDTFYTVCDRAQDDEQYHSAINTIFDLAHKWVHRSLDTVGDINRATSLDDFIDDPTPEKHLITAIRGLRTVLERLAGGKSLDDVFGALRVCGVDIQQDEELRQWSDDFLAHLRKSVDERGYVRSEEAKQKSKELREQWKKIVDSDTEQGRKWKKDIGKLKEEYATFQRAMDRDEELRNVRRAHTKLGGDLEETLLVAGSSGLQATMDKAPWFWQDLFNVYLPKAVGAFKDIPIPRTEYRDNDVEFVLEDLDISSFNLLPGHAYIRNITDIDIKAPSAGQADTAVGALTRVYIQALQLALREVSFYYKDKTASVGPAEFTGLLEFTLPPQGIDVDVVVRTIPNSPEGLKERARRSRFLEIQRVDVHVSEDVDLTIRESNHPILVSVFKPVMLSRFREALRTLLEQQVRSALDWLDALAWDVGRRAEVFGDAGLGRGASLVAGLWSELGHLQKGEGGLFSGWTATGTGVFKSDQEGTQFAMGAEPQVLLGEKRGPKGTLSDSIAERYDVDAEMEDARGIVEEAGKSAKAGVRKAKSFKDSVSAKAEEEKAREGWQSPAFDISA